MKVLPESIKQKGALIFFVLILGLFLTSFVFQKLYLTGPQEINPFVQVNSTFLPLIISVFAFLRYYSFKKDQYLFIGIGFLGATLLDIYDVIVVSYTSHNILNNELNISDNWGWTLSRLFLSILLLISWINWHVKNKYGDTHRIREKIVYTFSWIIVFSFFLLLAFVDLPKMYQDGAIVGRPYDLFSGLFFLLAFIGYLHKSYWKKNSFDFWVLIALIMSFMGQVVFMSFSHNIYDKMYNFGDWIKFASYYSILIGLVLQNFRELKSAQQKSYMYKVQAEELEIFKLAIANSSDSIVITSSNGKIYYANTATVKLTGYTKHEMLGKTPKLWGNQMSLEFYNDFWKQIKDDKQDFTGEFVNRKKNGEQYIAQAKISVITNKEGEIKYFVAISRDITKNKEMDQAKSDFISLASHQLRNPIGIEKWMIESLLDGDSGPLNEEQTDFVIEMRDANSHMIKLVETLLDVSKIESGAMTANPDSLDIRETIHKVIESLEDLKKKANIQTITNFNENISNVYFDPYLLTITIEALLRNAITYSKPNSEVQIKLTETDEFISMQIEDNGCGIPQRDLPKIFTKLFRAESAKKVEPNGTGLGLFLVKKIIDNNNCYIFFSSDENSGTIFNIKFRKATDNKIELNTPPVETDPPSIDGPQIS